MASNLDTTFLDPDVVGVVLYDGTTIPLADLQSTDDHGDVMWVLWANGRKSYGKAWTSWDGRVHRVVRVGAGAYGDVTVLRREVTKNVT